MTAQIRVQVGWDDIPGRHVLKDTIDFDGTPDGFDRAWEQLRLAFHERAAAPMRPCGHAGPWHIEAAAA